jgi:hypothetical protein
MDKLAKSWIYHPGQQALGYVELSGGGRLYTLWRVVEVRDGRPFVWSFDDDCVKPLGDAKPMIDDVVTAACLPDTARAMWQDESLHVVPFATNVDDGEGGTKPASWWAVQRLYQTESGGRTVLLVANNRHVIAPTHKQAWIAAIEAAPEKA